MLFRSFTLLDILWVEEEEKGDDLRLATVGGQDAVCCSTSVKKTTTMRV